MMRLTPIIKRDLEIKSRGMTLSAVITAINAVLFLAGLFGTFAIISAMKRTHSADYRSFLRVYAFVVMLEYLMVLFISPFFTAGAISGEKETGTFDLLLTTSLSPANIVLEKLASAWVSVAMVTVSFLPAMGVPLIFGGVGMQGVIGLALLMVIESVTVLSAGMFMSSMFTSSLRSMAATFAFLLLETAGLLIIAALGASFAGDGSNIMAYLLMFDPLLPVASVLSGQVGDGLITGLIYTVAGNGAGDFLLGWGAVVISVVVQLTLSFVLVVLSVMRIMPSARHKPLALRRSGE